MAPDPSPRPAGGEDSFTPLGSARATAERVAPAPAAPPSRRSTGTVAPSASHRRSSDAGAPHPAPAFDDAGPGVVPEPTAAAAAAAPAPPPRPPPYQPSPPPAAWAAPGGAGAPEAAGATGTPAPDVEAGQAGGGGDGGGAAGPDPPPPPPHPTRPHPTAVGRGTLGYAFTRASQPNPTAWALTLLWLAALAFYLYVRVARTLAGLAGAYLGYGAFVVAVEALGATTVGLYAFNLLFIPLHEAARPDPGAAVPGMPAVALPYHVRVLVPCYKEDLEIVQRTVLAAAGAPLPRGCARTVYLCDDGRDGAKKAWVKSLGAGFVYVSGRARPPGEMNGKSGNLNNVCRQLYPDGVDIPGNELVCVFDADQVATSAFFQRTLPLFDGGDDVAMVLSPQCFYNLDLHSDIFNHSNIHFWEYAQPGYDAVGFISCTGTNFLVRAKAFRDAGWSPEYTLTEDYALGMELKKRGWHCRYVQAYLAVGEAPSGVRNCFQQRSRWAKGHFQIVFNPRRNPLVQAGLPLRDRLLYCSGVWCYLVSSLTIPTYAAIPLITIWAGVFPCAIDRWFAAALTAYAAATQLLQYYVRTPRHVEALWFADVANAILWWAYVKAAWRMLWARIFFCCSSVSFKATAKGKGTLAAASIVGDVWLHAVFLFVLAVTVAVAAWQLVAGAAVLSPLLISLLWAAHAAVPPFLLLAYVAAGGPGIVMHLACRLAQLVSAGSALAAVGLVWTIKDFNPVQGGSGVINGKEIGLAFRELNKKVGASFG